MLLLSDNDLDFIHNSVKKFYQCSYDHRIAIEEFCGKAMEWLHDHDDDDDDDVDVSRITTVLRDNFPKIISAVEEKIRHPLSHMWLRLFMFFQLKNPEANPEEELLLRHACASARALAHMISYYNYPEAFLDSDYDEEEQEKSHILESDREEEFYDDQCLQSNSSDRKRLNKSDEEQQ